MIKNIGLVYITYFTVYPANPRQMAVDVLKKGHNN